MADTIGQSRANYNPTPSADARLRRTNSMPADMAAAHAANDKNPRAPLGNSEAGKGNGIAQGTSSGSQGTSPQGPSDFLEANYTYTPGSKPTGAPNKPGHQAPAGAQPPSNSMEQGGPVPHSGSKNGKGSIGLVDQIVLGALALVGLEFLLRSSADVTASVEIT